MEKISPLALHLGKNSNAMQFVRGRWVDTKPMAFCLLKQKQFVFILFNSCSEAPYEIEFWSNSRGQLRMRNAT